MSCTWRPHCLSWESRGLIMLLWSNMMLTASCKTLLVMNNCFLFYSKTSYNIFHVFFSGEIKGRILQQLIVDYGKLIEVGAIVVLRRPSVLQYTSECLITVTPNCLIGIYSSQNSPPVNSQLYASIHVDTIITRTQRLFRLPAADLFPARIWLLGCPSRWSAAIRCCLRMKSWLLRNLQSNCFLRRRMPCPKRIPRWRVCQSHRSSFKAPKQQLLRCQDRLLSTAGPLIRRLLFDTTHLLKV